MPAYKFKLWRAQKLNLIDPFFTPFVTPFVTSHVLNMCSSLFGEFGGSIGLHCSLMLTARWELEMDDPVRLQLHSIG